MKERHRNLNNLFQVDVMKSASLLWKMINFVLLLKSQNAPMASNTCNDTVLTGKYLAAGFNDYFVNLVSSTYESRCTEYLHTMLPDNSVFRPTTAQVILAAILSLKAALPKTFVASKKAHKIRCKHCRRSVRTCHKFYFCRMSFARTASHSERSVFKGGVTNSFSEYRPILIFQNSRSV